MRVQAAAQQRVGLLHEHRLLADERTARRERPVSPPAPGALLVADRELPAPAVADGALDRVAGLGVGDDRRLEQPGAMKALEVVKEDRPVRDREQVLGSPRPPRPGLLVATPSARITAFAIFMGHERAPPCNDMCAAGDRSGIKYG